MPKSERERERAMDLDRNIYLRINVTADIHRQLVCQMDDSSGDGRQFAKSLAVIIVAV